MAAHAGEQGAGEAGANSGSHDAGHGGEHGGEHGGGHGGGHGGATVSTNDPGPAHATEDGTAPVDGGRGRSTHEPISTVPPDTAVETPSNDTSVATRPDSSLPIVGTSGSATEEVDSGETIPNTSCNDGNRDTGDGCSPEGTIEPGFSCVTAPACASEANPCTLAVRATYRDFSALDPDFDHSQDRACGIPEGEPPLIGSVASELDAEGRPTLGNPEPEACIDSAISFARWYREGVKKEGSLTLYSNGQGGYVNRFGPNGEPLQVIDGTGAELQVNRATSPETCRPGCIERVSSEIQCGNVCRPEGDRLAYLMDRATALEEEVAQLNHELTLEEAADVPDQTAIDALRASIVEARAELDDTISWIPEQTALAARCETDCQANFDAQVAACVADCKPCSFDPRVYCTGGALQIYDGTPLFFPVDDIEGPTSNRESARLPEAFGYVGWPDEQAYFPNAAKHNFYFTTELQHWFRFDPGQSQVLTFAGDDDLWVFINGILAVDLGGIHTPLSDSVTLDASAGARFGLEAGQVYSISVFHAERTLYGSTLLVTFPNSGELSVCIPNP